MNRSRSGRKCRSRGSSITTAIALVCALSVLVLPGQASADPAPPPAAGGEGDKSLDEVRRDIDALYRKAGAATDAYNLAEDQAQGQSGEIVKLARSIVAGEERINELKDRLGAQARAQYRTGGVPQSARLMLSGDPDLFLRGAGRMQQGQAAVKGMLDELTRTQEDLRTYSQDASSEWQKLEANRKRKEKAQKEVKKQIAAAEKLEARLEEKERSRLLELEREEQYRAQTAWLNSGALKNGGKGGAASTAQGKQAVSFATAQIGDPYVWGAEGPAAFDCSGLTQQAWRAAGRAVPRTSQEQWRLLPKVAVADMRPGDLIIYFPDASHVAMYVGDGAMVHAPRPGRTVTIAGAGSMPILGVVRPG
ncbi:NlpC/P60 family protein [Streptomyces sp. NPDC091272]|uniref:C40 family peptidase n=1 Tax=Streptomyces sp. NPDC091272 TaxID=3365981 RepID=UPI003814D46A